MWAKIVCLVIGYGFGLFQTGYFYGKRNGIDIRKYGSGNAGTTNALRTLGKKAGAITLAGDCLKAILAILLVSLIFGRAFPEQIMLLKLYAGAGCVLGHNFPFYQEECDHSGNGTAAHDHPVADLQDPTGTDDGTETDGEEVPERKRFLHAAVTFDCNFCVLVRHCSPPFLIDASLASPLARSVLPRAFISWL